MFFFSQELFDCSLPPESSLVLKGNTHDNGTGTSNHCEHLAYLAISSDISIDKIKRYYENNLSYESVHVYLYNEEDEYPIKCGFYVFKLNEKQKKQLYNAKENKKSIYLIAVTGKCDEKTCLSGH